MNYAWNDVAGNVGVGLIIIMYLLLQLDKISSTDIRYSVFNALGAALVVVSLLYKFNLSAFLIEAFWVLISLLGIARYFAGGKTVKRKPD